MYYCGSTTLPLGDDSTYYSTKFQTITRLDIMFLCAFTTYAKNYSYNLTWLFFVNYERRLYILNVGNAIYYSR